MSEDEQRRREDAARQFLDVLFVTTEHRDITKVQAFREMCEAAITVYNGPTISAWRTGLARLCASSTNALDVARPPPQTRSWPASCSSSRSSYSAVS
jgi:hypothetical protein